MIQKKIHTVNSFFKGLFQNRDFESRANIHVLNNRIPKILKFASMGLPPLLPTQLQEKNSSQGQQLNMQLSLPCVWMVEVYIQISNMWRIFFISPSMDYASNRESLCLIQIDKQYIDPHFFLVYRPPFLPSIESLEKHNADKGRQQFDWTIIQTQASQLSKLLASFEQSLLTRVHLTFWCTRDIFGFKLPINSCWSWPAWSHRPQTTSFSYLRRMSPFSSTY